MAGESQQIFLPIHVVISLIAMASGIVVLFGLLTEAQEVAKQTR